MKHLQKIVIDQYHEISSLRPYSSLQLRACHPRRITSYKKLIKRFAELSSNNPTIQIMFRGQNKDYRDSKDETLLLPSIYRNIGNNVDELKRRFAILSDATQKLSKRFRGHTYPRGLMHLAKHKELCWAILQHYEVCCTPLLDITPDLDSALSFAVSKSTNGVLYAIGISNHYKAFEHDFDQDMVFLRLDSLMPSTALRPFFQRGCLIGTWPIVDNKFRKKYDVSMRLLAIIEVEKKYLQNSGFNEKGNDFLFPNRGDNIYKICSEIKKGLKAKYKTIC